MSREELYAAAKEALTYKQLEAWKLVVWDGMPKRAAARQLQISRPALDERLAQAERRVCVLPVFVRERRQDEQRGREAHPGDVRPLGRRATPCRAGSSSPQGLDRGREPGAEAA